ncbi:lytic transglycosylase domain-containing protein [Microbacterium sp. C7(2022)]|nr:lytic transglycosylase domain-containing protein [Microbacterium sp. C7(2022)]
MQAARHAPKPRWSRRRGVMSAFAVFAVAAFAASYIGPLGAAIPQASAAETPTVSLFAHSSSDVQSVTISEAVESAAEIERDGYTVFVKPTPTPTPVPVAASVGSTGSSWQPPFVTPNPGSAQAIAFDMVSARGWGNDQYACLVALWKKESGWRVNAYNAGSGAYGIPQALPGSKMASAGADWETNPATQIAWGLGYISARYGSPCGAWDHSTRVGWY